MAANGLKLLMGDYNSDSETDEEVSNAETPPPSAKTDVSVAVDAFVSELEAATTPTTISTSWTQCIDKATGHPYYWHPETKEVTWEIPVEYQAFLDQNADQLSGSNVASMWTVCLTDGEEPAQRYYVNEYTRIVSWDKPVGFVEPLEATAKNASARGERDAPVSKNVIKRRKVQPKQKGEKRENPYSKPTELENEKIELISSFTAKSDSSSDEEDASNSKPLKLVATDYNSDTDNNTSVLDTSGTICATVPKTHKKLTVSDRSSSQPKDDVVALASNDPVEKCTKKKSTFASIITGGRSPEHADNSETGTAISDEAAMPDSQRTEISVATSIVKTQKRKRRIEFITKAPEVDDAQETHAVCTKSDENATEHQKKDMYANFKRSHVEFVDKKCTANDEGKETADRNRSTSKSPIETTKSDELKNTIEAKLKFLCEGRPEVPAVQAILIQLETLLEAFDEGALQATYMNKWLDSIATDLQTLEADAAPPGWKCIWNRDNTQYCYVHQRSGEVRWEYPTVDTDDTAAAPMSASAVAASTETTKPVAVPSTSNNNNGVTKATRQDDDEMDICTTPPPSADIALPKPLPSGTDEAAEGHSITAELASFYSDLATIETAVDSALPTTVGETVADPIVETPIVDGDEAAAVAKKKKRKIKKLQPWRSGNLETWINKWAKAQQELEN